MSRRQRWWLAVGCGAGVPVIVLAVVLLQPETITQRQGNWLVHYRLTGRGEADAKEDLNLLLVRREAELGSRVDRAYEGRRVRVAGTFGRWGARPAGRYTVHGTVSRVDAADEQLWLTDCVFVPAD